MVPSTPPAAPDPKDEYRLRRDARAAEAAALDLWDARLAVARLVTFGAGIVTAWLAGVTRVLPLPWIGLPVVVFLVLLVAHDGVLGRRARRRRAVAYYERGLARLDGSWAGTGEQGAEFRDPAHPFADDLDLFGRGSVFERIAQARTQPGLATLAAWLLGPAPAAEIRRRQEAVADMRGRVDLREDLTLLGEDVRHGVHPRELAVWAAAPATSRRAPSRAVAATLSAITILALLGWPAGLTGRGIVAAAILLQTAYLLRHRARVEAVLNAIERPARELELLGQALGRLAGERWNAAILAELQASIGSGPDAAAGSILRLHRHVERLHWAANPFFAPVAAVLFWRLHLAEAIEAWRQRHGRQVEAWLGALGAMEALASLGAYAYECPSLPFPEVREGVPRFTAEALEHPLLPEATRVGNDVALGDGLALLLVSGSNMSGKSTLLRAVGVNTVLAMAGAPVTARRLTLTPFALGATLHVQDSLQAGASRFYAEISRIRQVLEACGGPYPVLYLLDELLHGTNSHDRRVGAEAVLGAFVARGALGLVTTHDLALAPIADALAPRAANVHFEDRLEEGRIVFDYRLRQGVVQHGNALALMRAVGLPL